MSEQRSRIRLFVGKGGAGTTTLAVASALVAAAGGSRVLVISMDQPGSLADVTGIPSSQEITTLTDRVDVRQLDTLALLENKFRSVAGLLAAAGRHEHDAAVGTLEPEELTGSLGIQDLLGLGEIVSASTSGEYDLVIVDCPAAGETVRILGSPAMVSEYLERVWPRHRRLGAGTGGDMRLALLVSVVERVLASVDSIAAHLADRELTSVRLVSTPDAAGVGATRRAMSALALAGLRVDGLIVNNLLPDFGRVSEDPSPARRWLSAARAAQTRAIDELRRSIGGTSVTIVERTAVEPVGLAALDGIAAALQDRGCEMTDSGEIAENITVSLESGTGTDSVYVMRMYLPLVDPSSLSLGRVEDDVLVGADGVRRRIRLVSVLRRCVVTGAELDGSHLLIRFAPDAAVWPS